MIQNTQITVLVENCTRKHEMLAEHGLSFWIEADDHKILFDTGQGNALAWNLKNVGKPISSVNSIVISHGHFDHIGGLKPMLSIAKKSNIYLHSNALRPKYCKTRTGSHYIGSPQNIISSLLDNNSNRTWSNNPTEISKHIHLTGEIPRKNEFETIEEPFFEDKECLVEDLITDDQALYISMHHGLVVVLGCAHSGVVNTLEYIKELTGVPSVHTLIGGMHLENASEKRMAETVKALKKFDVKNLYPLHCTGERAKRYFWQEMPEICRECSTGSVISID